MITLDKSWVVCEVSRDDIEIMWGNEGKTKMIDTITDEQMGNISKMMNDLLCGDDNYWSALKTSMHEYLNKELFERIVG